MHLLLPAHEVPVGDPLGAGGLVAELDLQVHADGVLAPAGEAVVVGERVAPPIGGDQHAAGGKAAHQASSSSS